MNPSKIDRINVLARKAKTEGLDAAEKEEQKNLRQEYIKNIRQNLRGQLEQIDVINVDGTMENLGEKYAQKNN
jgi:uncharacterized protein YnzC (UPF0291/DUF896 family)